MNGRVSSFLRDWMLPLAIAGGIAAYFIYVNIAWLNPTHAAAASVVAWLQPSLIFAMLFLTFLNIGPHDLHLRRWHLWHILVQLGAFGLIAGMLAYFAQTPRRILLESAMVCLLCPTATAAAVVTRKLGGRAADITSYTIIINLAVAVTAPVLLPLAHPHEGLSFLPTFGMIMMKVFPLLIMPLVCAWAVRRWLPAVAQYLRRWPDLAFYLWAVALSLAIATTVKAIMHSRVPAADLAAIGAVSLACCLLQFFIGKAIGRRYGEHIEGGQALGQKNTVFIIWLAYTFLSPVTAVAGGLYSIWHNLFNSYQLYKARHRNLPPDKYRQDNKSV